MTEIEYIRSTNRVKVTAALAMLRDVLPGEDCGVDESKFLHLVRRLREIEEYLFTTYEIEESK